MPEPTPPIPPPAERPAPRRTIGGWCVLLLVWIVGLAIWAVYISLGAVLLLKFL